MSWEDLEGKSQEAEKQQAVYQERLTEMCRAYSRCFATEDGEKVLQDLTKRFLIENDTPLSSHNVEYEAAYHNGEAGVIRMIIHYIQQAERL